MSGTEKISIKKLNIQKRIADIYQWAYLSAKDKKDLVEGYSKDLKIGKVTGKVVDDGGISVYLDDLRIVVNFLKKSISKYKEEDILKLHEAMVRDELTYERKKRETDSKGDVITKTYQRPYAKNKKNSIKRSLNLFLKWRFPDKFHKFEKILRIKLQGKTKEVHAHREEQVEKLRSGCKENSARYLVTVLFDSGMRAEEFHNVRMSDIIFPKDKENYIKIRVRDEFSKTKGRVISLYWKYSTKDVTDYYNERLKEGAQPEEPIFNHKYSNMRKFLARLGLRTIGIAVHYHSLRHASCSHYIYIIKNDHQMCYRYGWNFGSPMIQRYSRRRDMSEELDKEVEHTEINSLKSEIEKLKLSNDMKDKEMNKKNKEFASVLESHNQEMKQIRELLKVLKKSSKDS